MNISCCYTSNATAQIIITRQTLKSTTFGTYVIPRTQPIDITFDRYHENITNIRKRSCIDGCRLEVCKKTGGATSSAEFFVFAGLFVKTIALFVDMDARFSAASAAIDDSW